MTSVSEYLSTSYRPDCDLVDGQLTERNLGEYDHASIQGALITWFGNRQREWNIRVLPEQRVQVTSSRFRIPDVCVISRDQPIEQVIVHAALICIEVLSKDDTLRSLQDRIDDYLNFGVAEYLGFRTGLPPRLHLYPQRLPTTGRRHPAHPRFPDLNQPRRAIRRSRLATRVS